jgi:hypothetical protein
MKRFSAPKRLLATATAAGAARGAYQAFTRSKGTARWERTNHRGEPVTLLEGPAVVAGAALAVAGTPGVPARLRAAGLIAVTATGALGAYDDLAGSGSSRGFKGHLAALARGEVTSGAVKLLGIGATGLAAAATRPRRGRPGAGSWPVDLAIDSVLIAGSANLLNLFDLRPGRATKVALATGVPLLATTNGPLAGAAVGAAGALLPEDLGERAMLGDAGANAIGALLGLAATGLPRRARLAALGAVVGLTAASEYVSFTKVIRSTPPLHYLDMLGRRPVEEKPSPAEPGLAREC